MSLKAFTGVLAVITAAALIPLAAPASADQSYPPGTYLVPLQMPYGTYVAHNVEGAWPGCTYGTYTADGIVIDVFNGSLEPWSFARIYSPAIATFVSGPGCTPWELTGT
ncbi:hypothetical protein [Mycobacterium sp. E740]|uniref:hypothetical protein n=1 Tax=Mycobacterium sp. E740 TaxID=1834149 RepID=UPI000800645A|nr:hypothetical protein [Mycobacterium sp. E740]OBI72810.1 hypothetical protein A5663_07655 [Mycobacterium sp. E740]